MFRFSANVVEDSSRVREYSTRVDFDTKKAIDGSVIDCFVELRYSPCFDFGIMVFDLGQKKITELFEHECHVPLEKQLSRLQSYHTKTIAEVKRVTRRTLKNLAEKQVRGVRHSPYGRQTLGVVPYSSERDEQSDVSGDESENVYHCLGYMINDYEILQYHHYNYH